VDDRQSSVIDYANPPPAALEVTRRPISGALGDSRSRLLRTAQPSQSTLQTHSPIHLPTVPKGHFMTDQPAPLPLAAGDCPTYVVAGGDHVTILLDRAQSCDLLDVIDVCSQPGDRPPAHRHSFVEWVRVLEGELTLCEARNGTMRPTNTLAAGDSLFVAPWSYHATLNLSRTACRFQIVGQPAMMSGYFAQAGVRVADATAVADRAPVDADQLSEIARRWGIQFWNGPTDPAGRPTSDHGSGRVASAPT
jgi:quercetin dioxygenase-like cupin family protein